MIQETSGASHNPAMERAAVVSMDQSAKASPPGLGEVFVRSVLLRMVSRADLFACSLLLALIVVVMWFVSSFDYWFGDQDKLAQFVPWFGYIGDTLRNGHLPVWNMYEAAGQPFIGAPASGWLSIPIIVCFTLFPNVLTGYMVFVLVHMLLGGFGTYAFCRVLGMAPYAALVAGSVYATGPVLYSAMRWEAASGQVLMFVPLAMLAIELAIRSPRLSGTLAWAALAGLVECQMYVSSIPRVIYPTMLIAGWMAWRLLVAPLPEVGDRKRHLVKLAIIGAVLSVAFLGTVAAALLPQLDYNAQTNVAGSEYDVPNGNYTAGTLPYAYAFDNVFGDGQTFPRTRFISLAVAVLAVLAVLGYRRRFGAMFFALATLGYIDFTTQGSFVREVLWLVPGVEAITHHRPISATLGVAFPMAVLGGAGANWLLHTDMRLRLSLLRFVPPMIVGAGVLLLQQQGHFVGWWPVAAAGLVSIAIILWPARDATAGGYDATIRQYTVHGVLLLAVLLMPIVRDLGSGIAQPLGDSIYTQMFIRKDAFDPVLKQIVASEDPGTSAGWLQERANLSQPFRHAAWTGMKSEKQVWINQTVADYVGMVTNGRPMELELQHVYSYNPSQVKAYVDYLDILNGMPQDYHFTELRGAALNQSPLLNMLNVRYIITSAKLDPPPPIAQWGTIVYQDNQNIIYENPDAYARAWIVHDVRPAMDGQELHLINTGQVDGHLTAFVDGEQPPVAAPAAGSVPDSVSVTSYEPETIHLNAASTADGLLVLSEIYVEGWNAYVDGKRVDILRTNHTLRGVPLPAGDHEVVLRYEPRALTIGLWSTGVTSVAMIGVWIWAGLVWRRRPASERRQR